MYLLYTIMYVVSMVFIIFTHNVYVLLAGTAFLAAKKKSLNAKHIQGKNFLALGHIYIIKK